MLPEEELGNPFGNEPREVWGSRIFVMDLLHVAL